MLYPVTPTPWSFPGSYWEMCPSTLKEWNWEIHTPAEVESPLKEQWRPSPGGGEGGPAAWGPDSGGAEARGEMSSRREHTGCLRKYWEKLLSCGDGVRDKLVKSTSTNSEGNEGREQWVTPRKTKSTAEKEMQSWQEAWPRCAGCLLT